MVDELTEPEARAFLAEAVGLAEADLPPAAAVVRECGRLPLALALAGATLADDPDDAALWHDVVEALAKADHEQLQAEFDYPYPHLLAVIQASVDDLPAPDRAAYLQLAIFPEDTPIPLAPLEKLWGLGGLSRRNRVRLLVDRALARRQNDGSILLHDLQGDFVRKRCPDLRAAHDTLLRGYHPDQTQPWADVADDSHLLDWLPLHLMGAGRGEECRDLLFDRAWLHRKLAARDVQALIADTRRCADDLEVERLRRVLRMAAHVLDRDPRELTAQLVGRLGEEDGNRAARLLDAAWREMPAELLVPRRARHLLPRGPLLQTLEGHRGPVSGAVVSADGARALSWSEDQTLRLWNLESGANRVLEGHDGSVSGAVVLADGARALSWSDDRTLRLWDLESGASRMLLGGHGGSVSAAVVPADDARVLSWSDDHSAFGTWRAVPAEC